MRRTRRSAYTLLALVAALIVLTCTAPFGAATPTEIRSAPLSADFLRYRANLKLRHVLGLDDVPSFVRGYVPAPKDVSYLRGARIGPLGVTYPSSFDLRALNKVSPVEDQNPYGACWTFATDASLESGLLPGEVRDFSEDNLALNAGFDIGGYDGGGNLSMSTAYLIRWSGPIDESQDAYGDWYTPPGLSAVKHVQEVRYIPGGSSGNDTANIKYALTTWGAVATSMSWQDSAYNAAKASFYYGGSDASNHAVTIVGWNDDYSAFNFAAPPPGNGAWLVKNSWGTAWGQSGFFWVSYFDSRCGTARVKNAVFNGVQPLTNFSDVYFYDPLGEVGGVGLGSETAWGANVFTAHRAQSISAVGFFAAVPGTTYVLYAGTSLSALQARGSGSFTTPGYYTVALSSPLTVTGGSQFAVAVRITTPGYQYPLSLEYAEPGYSSAASASPGQSFASGDGSGWDDLATGYDSPANFCLKAYAGPSGPTPPPSPTPTPTSTPPPSPTPTPTSTSTPPPSPTPSPTPTDPADNVGPVCGAKNVTVKHDRSCKLRFRVYDPDSAEVTTTLAVTTKSGTVKRQWSWGYEATSSGWWWVKYTCRLPKGTYRIVVRGMDLAGNSQSVTGRATLTVKQ